MQRVSDSATFMAGQFAGRYDIQRQLGQGATSKVYLARDTVYGRDVALKVLRPELVAAISAQRFLREIRLTAKLQHPNIIPVLDSGEDKGNLFCVLPYMEGGTLRTRLTRDKQMPLSEVVDVGACCLLRGSTWIVAQRRGEAGMPHVETAQPVVARTQVELPGSQPQGFRALNGRVLDDVGFLVHERIRVLREPARRREQQAFVLRRRLEQALDQLEAEGRRLCDELRIIVAGPGRPRIRERVGNLVDRVLPRRTGSAYRRGHSDNAGNDPLHVNARSIRPR